MANDPNSMSQDDIDALINQASGAAPSPAPSQGTTPVKAPAGPQGALGQDDIDALINLTQASAPTTQAVPVVAKPVAAPSGAMGQDEIDALINQVQASAPVAKAVAAAPKPAPVAAASGAMGQDEIDALINQVQASAPVAKAVAAAPKAAASSSGSLGQDDIDALINQVQASAPVSKAVAAAPKAAASSSGSLGQDDIDALINQVQSPAPTANKAAASAPGKALDQDAIDALLNQTTPSPAPAMGSTKRKKRESITEMLDSVQEAANAKAQANPDDNQSGPLGQDDIDKLLADLGAKTTAKPGTSKQTASAVPSVPTTAVAVAAQSQKPGTTTSNASAATIIAPMMEVMPSGPGPTLALSADDLDALVDRQVGVISEHGEAPMIDQGDIDALVKQLANATGAPNTQKISDALAKHEGEIDKLLEQAGNAKATMDAMPASGLISGNSAATRGGPTITLGVPVMAPAELKGARWLLVAAVLFLAICATTLGMVVNAINGLSSELKTQREAALTPSNSFANDYKAAVAQLAAQDATEVAKGVLFMGRLKARYPGHEAEIALALGRHFRAKGAFHQAADEFATLAETGHGLFDDPRIFLDYAVCLTELGDMPAATRQVYRLLANEDSYLAPRDRNGLTRPGDEVVRNQQAVQDAYLTLGRMLGTASQQGHERATASKHAAANGHEAADSHAAPASHDDHKPAASAATHDAHGGH